VACYEVLTQHLPGWTEKNLQELAEAPAEIPNSDLQNTELEC